MKVAAVSELKASLSEFLSGVKSGEEIVVTERGRPIARLVPIRAPEIEQDARMAELARQGLVRLGTGKIPRGFWRRKRPKDPTAGVRAALTAERESDR
jgi:prevent-host-death family protein